MEDTAPVLNAAEARLLGCLIEKEATTPETYPLTVNAAQAAANQKTAREPVMALDPGAVNHALRQLEQKGLAKQVFSSRAERYEHRTAAFFGIPQQQAVLLGLLRLTVNTAASPSLTVTPSMAGLVSPTWVMPGVPSSSRMVPVPVTPPTVRLNCSVGSEVPSSTVGTVTVKLVTLAGTVTRPVAAS